MLVQQLLLEIFGGVVLLGDAQTNTGVTTNVIEGLGDQPNVSDFYYGGTNNSHDAGDLNYVRIEYAGRILDAVTGVEINGLTFGGVGAGTVVDHIQVSYGRDDSYEWFGGTVNASHLISLAPDDDNFDFDFGYTGTVTKAIAIADKNSTHSLSGGAPDSNGIELDNNAAGSLTTLITRPVIREMSIVGFQCPDQSVLENGIHVRRRGQIDLQDVTVTGYPIGLNFDGTASAPSNSTWSALSIHGGTDDVLPAGTLLGGFDNEQTVGCPMPTWGLTQPFFNVAGFSLSGSTGAFTSESNWASATWVKFSGF